MNKASKFGRTLLVFATLIFSCDEVKEEVFVPDVVADFDASGYTIVEGESVNFIDKSEGNPTKWNWTFLGGTPAQSDLQNPTITYLNSGVFDVKLIASNDAKSDTVEFTNFIHVVQLPNEGLIAHYPLNGNANDISSNKNNGQVFGAVPSPDRNGLSNSSFLFDGINDQINLPFNSQYLELPLTFSFWIRFTSLKSAVFSNDVVDSKQSGVWFSVGQATETLNKLAINYGNGGPPSADSRKTFIADKELQKDQWYHIVGTIKNENNMLIYINNELVNGFYSGFANAYAHTGGDGILGRVWDPVTFFHGNLDNLRIYNRILSEEEVSALFNEP